MPSPKGKKHLGSRDGTEGGQLETMCGLPVLKNDTIIDPKTSTPDDADAARKSKTLCPACWKLMDAYAVGYSAGQISVLRKFMVEDPDSPMFEGPSTMNH